MAVLKVLPYPNPFLRTRAKAVEAFDDTLKATVKDMMETMAAEDGLGLAATQVGIDARLLIVNPFAFRGEAARGEPDVVIINPEILGSSNRLQVAMFRSHSGIIKPRSHRMRWGNLPFIFLQDEGSRPMQNS